MFIFGMLPNPVPHSLFPTPHSYFPLSAPHSLFPTPQENTCFFLQERWIIVIKHIMTATTLPKIRHWRPVYL
jgi:hypothetical protein